MAGLKRHPVRRANKGNTNHASVSAFIAKFRAMGWTMMDFVGYENLTIDADGVNRIDLFGQTGVSAGLGTTNFTKAGELDKETAMIWTHIAADIRPGAVPAAFGAQAVAARVNDMDYLARRGTLYLTKGSSRGDVLQVGPLGVLPGNAGIGGLVALADVSTTGGNMQSRIQAIHTVGPTFALKNPIILNPGDTYGGKLDFGNAALVVPSTVDATVTLRYHGLRFVKA